jgi:hypothetical protein
MRKPLLIILAVVFLIVILGGYFLWSYMSTNNQTPNNNTSSDASVEQIRDQAMVYLAANHTQTMPLMASLQWTGGRQETGKLGAESNLYTSGAWSVMIEHPVVLDPVYTINVNYSSADWAIRWVGSYHMGILDETTSTISNNTQIALTQPQIRDLMMQYLNAYHNQSSPFMHNMMWTGGRMNMGMMVGSDKYSYQSTGWNMTVQNPVVPTPVYTITIKYVPPDMHTGDPVITWEGTLHNGVITETKFGLAYNI